MRRSSRPARLSGTTSNLHRQPQPPAFIGTSLVRPRAAMSKADAVAQMSIDMRETAETKGGVTADDLQLLGFTAAQIAALAPDAALRAQAEAVSS